MKQKFLLFILLLALPALACGSDLDATSTPQVSTATSPAEETEAEAEVAELEPTEEEVMEEEAPPTDTPEPVPTDEPAPTDTPEPTATAIPQANLGDLAEMEGYSFAALTLEDPAVPGQFYEPQEGTRLVAVEIVVGNVGGERVTVNALNSTLVDSEGFTHQPELGGRANQLELTDLEPGERVKGWVSFAIPEEVMPDQIKYEVSGFPRIELQSNVLTADGAPVADPNIPLSASEEVARSIDAQLGDLVEKDGYSFVVEAIEDPGTPGRFYEPSQEGTKLIAVQMVVGNESGELETINALNTRLIDSNGYVYSPALGGHDEQMELTDLNAGERVRGWVAFEVPEDATASYVRYQVSGFPIVELESGVAE